MITRAIDDLRPKDSNPWPVKLVVANPRAIRDSRRLGAHLVAAASTHDGEWALHATADRIRLVSVEDGAFNTFHCPAGHRPTAIAISVDGRTFLSGDSTGAVYHWSRDRQEPSRLQQETCAITAIALGNDNVAAIGDDAGNITLVDTAMQCLAGYAQLDSAISRLLLVDGFLIAGTRSGRVAVLDPVTGRTLWQLSPHAGGVRDLGALGPSGIVTVAEDGKLCVFSKEADPLTPAAFVLETTGPLHSFALLSEPFAWAVASGTRIGLVRFTGDEWLCEHDLGETILDLRQVTARHLLATTRDGTSRVLAAVEWSERLAA